MEALAPQNFPLGWDFDPSAPGWRTEQSLLALIATAVAAFPAHFGGWTLLFGAGFLVSLLGTGPRWRHLPAAVFATGAFAFLSFLVASTLAISEAIWFGSWPLPLMMLAGLILVWLGPALAECLAAWQYIREKKGIAPKMFSESDSRLSA